MRMSKKIIFCSLVLIVLSVGFFRNGNDVAALGPIKYQVILSKMDTFGKKVDSLLQKGWDLQGGVALHVQRLNGNVWLAQALVKK